MSTALDAFKNYLKFAHETLPPSIPQLDQARRIIVTLRQCNNPMVLEEALRRLVLLMDALPAPIKEGVRATMDAYNEAPNPDHPPEASQDLAINVFLEILTSQDPSIREKLAELCKDADQRRKALKYVRYIDYFLTLAPFYR